MNNNTIVGIIVALVVIIGGYYIINNNKKTTDMTAVESMTPTPSVSTEATSTEPVATSTPGATVGTGKVVSFDVMANNFNFTPSTMTVNKGDTVKITVHNNGGTHDLKIDEFKASTKLLQTGQTETIQFVADKTGTFEYYCSVGNHRAMGMKGTLTVK